jgi:hypothetical protein
MRAVRPILVFVASTISAVGAHASCVSSGTLLSSGTISTCTINNIDGLWDNNQPNETGVFTGSTGATAFFQVTSAVPPGVQISAHHNNETCYLTPASGLLAFIQRSAEVCQPNTIQQIYTLTDPDNTQPGFFQQEQGSFSCQGAVGLTANFAGHCIARDSNGNRLVLQPTPVGLTGPQSFPTKVQIPDQGSLVCQQDKFSDNTPDWYYTCTEPDVFPSFDANPPLTDAQMTIVSMFKPVTWVGQAKENLEQLHKASGKVGDVAAILAESLVLQKSEALKVIDISNHVGAAAVVLSTLTDLAATNDPPDLNYTTIVTPAPPNFNVSAYPPAAAQLVQALEQASGLAEAIYTTGNRATGAVMQGDANSEQLQVGALPGFEVQLSVVTAQLPALLSAWEQELVASGVDPTALALSAVTAAQQDVAANGLPSSLMTALTDLGGDPSTFPDIASEIVADDPETLFTVLQNGFNTGPLMPPSLAAASNLQQFAAILPVSRSIPSAGSAATAFVTIVNSGAATAHSCVITTDYATDHLLGSFLFQTTNPATNALTGTPNTPVDIPPGGAQTFLIALQPNTAFPPVFANFMFYCVDANPAPIVSGLNTLLLSASTDPVPDIVALAASGDPGIVDVSVASNAGAFAVATVNVGASGAITAAASASSTTLPITVATCQTVPATGACMAPPAANVSTTINPGDTPTFAVFVTGTGSVPFDPTNNRVFMVFTDASGTVRGSTSVAVRTQ